MASKQSNIEAQLTEDLKRQDPQLYAFLKEQVERQKLGDEAYETQQQQTAGQDNLEEQITDLLARLAVARRQAKISQAELAANIGMSQSSLARMEAGRTNPTLKNLLKITNALGLQLTTQRKSA